jgi:hypothetical protein
VFPSGNNTLLTQTMQEAELACGPVLCMTDRLMTMYRLLWLTANDIGRTADDSLYAPLLSMFSHIHGFISVS